MPSTKNMAAAFLLTGMALAEPLATLEVCPAAGEKAPTCTVTAQHQPVSTCVPTTTACAADKGCSTGYAMSTYAYVNTVIPCAWDGKSMSSCHVTKTDQSVPCSMSESTMTTSVPYVKTVSKYGHSKVLTSYSTSYETMSKQWVAPYNKLGGMAIPGYEGCDLCEECGEQEDGSKMQHFEVTECSSGEGKEQKCEKYMENRVHMKAAPASTTPCTATNSIKTHVPSAGTYVFTFTNTAPPATITQDSHVYTIPGKPWFNYETRSCNGPEDFDFTVTVTKTVVMNAYETKTGASKAQVDPTEVANWGAWNGPANAPAQVTGQAQNGQKEHAGSSEYFLIPINSGSGSKYSKNGNQYVGFPSGGDDAGMVGKEHAAYFYWDMEGNLMCEGHYISTNTNSGYLVFEKTQEKPSGGYKFTVSFDGSFGMGGGAGFCATESTFFITFSGAPSGCKPVSAHVGGGYGQPDKIWQQWSHTTMMTSMTSSWSAWKTTTSTADPSGDMDWYSWPQETAAPRKRGGMLRKRMN